MYAARMYMYTQATTKIHADRTHSTHATTNSTSNLISSSSPAEYGWRSSFMRMKVCWWECINMYVLCGSPRQLDSDTRSLQGLPWSLALASCWHLAHKSPCLHASCWSRSPRTQRHRSCTHTHTFMQTRHWSCYSWLSSRSPPVSCP